MNVSFKLVLVDNLNYFLLETFIDFKLSSFFSVVNTEIVASFCMCLSNNQDQILLDLACRTLHSFLEQVNSKNLILLGLASRIVLLPKARQALVPEMKPQPRFACDIINQETWHLFLVMMHLCIHYIRVITLQSTSSILGYLSNLCFLSTPLK